MNKKHPIENKIYSAIIGICEDKESMGVYRGNGHHLAQQLTKAVSESLLSMQQKKIYSAVGTSPTPTKEISAVCKIPSKTVSAQLIQMSRYTLLVSSKSNGKLKLWQKR